MDLKDVLQEEVKETPPQTTEVHKKPIQLRDIENRSSSRNRVEKYETREQMTELLNQEKNLIYKQPWNKLEKGLKINRLKDYVQRCSQEDQLTVSQTQQLKDLLVSACTNNQLNRMNDISYNKEEGYIQSIKLLQKKEGIYTLKVHETKAGRSGGKPKSNIDRFLKSAK